MAIARLRRAIASALTFRHLRTRLAVLYAGLFALALFIVAAAAQVMILAHARNSVRAELSANADVYDRVWTLRTKALSRTADVLARDFGFRSAIGSGDRPTIESAVVTLRNRSEVPGAFVVDQAGEIYGAGSTRLRGALATLPYDLPPGRDNAVIDVGGTVFRVVVSPILAPNLIGWMIFALPLDVTEMTAIEHLSAIPLNVRTLFRDSTGHWISSDRAIGPELALDRFIAGSNRDSAPLTIRVADQTSYARAKVLPGRGTMPEAALLFSYPQSRALASYRALQIGIALAGLLGLVLVMLGSRRLAMSISRPIVALDTAAKALEEGVRAQVTVEGTDEIARLAQSFNLMSAGITEREHRITHLAFHDSLTGLPNRSFFRQHLEANLARLQKLDGTVTVLCLDLDGFKGVNDTLGHPVGDELLRQIGAILAEVGRDGLVSRLGGDEFAIILDDRGGRDRSHTLARAIIDAVRQPLTVDGHQILTSASIGIAIGPGDGADPDVLLKNADLALYRAKQDGRGVFRFFEPALDAAARKRRQLELDLREALRSGQFHLNYQPIFDLRTNRIGSFEALLRWTHPTRGNVPPAEFVPVAEDTGLIVAIGAWVMQEACRQACDWPDDIRVAVNVSPLQFRNSGFANVIFQALSRTGLAPGRLEVEITESVFLDGEESVVALLHRLRAMGVRVALDDFGTGYSSLSYLRSFPFDKIKIDKSFVDQIAIDPSSAAIVRAIVDLAGALHMETTAEGVESADQLAELRSQGCVSIQGYLFSRPVAAGQVPNLLAQSVRAAA